MKKIISVLMSLTLILSVCISPSYAKNENDAEYIPIDVDIPVYNNGYTPYADVGTSLSSDELAKVEKIIRDAIENMETGFDVSSLRIPVSNDHANAIFALFQNIINDTPEYFYAKIGVDSSGHSTAQCIGYYEDNDANKYYIKEFQTAADYRYNSLAEVQSITEQIETEAELILKEMAACGAESDFDKALYLHDHLAATIAYDTTLTRQRLDNALLEKSTVCSGYALAYKYLLNKCGIECKNVYYTPKSGSGHEWSMIKLGGEWYHVDVTFDDPTPDYAGMARHKYFLLNDAQLEEISDEEQTASDLSHSDWTTNSGKIPCNGTAYENAFWRTAYVTNYPIAFVGNDRYFVTYNTNAGNDRKGGKIYKFGSDLTSPAPFHDIDGLWYINVGNNVRFWASYYGGLGACENYLYYNTGNKVWRLDTSESDPVAEMIIDYAPGSLDTADAQLFGSYVFNGVLSYYEGNFINGNLYGTDNANPKTYDIGVKKNVTFKFMNSVVKTESVAKGQTISEPDYTAPCGYYITGWYKDSDCTQPWNFDTDTVNGDMVLYADAEEISINQTGSLSLVNGRLRGNLNAAVSNSDVSAKYFLCVYDKDGALKYTSVSDSGTFISGNEAIDHEIANGSLTYKIFAWSSSQNPYTAPADGIVTVKTHVGGGGSDN